jgi:hypothetical protein
MKPLSPEMEAKLTNEAVRIPVTEEIEQRCQARPDILLRTISTCSANRPSISDTTIHALISPSCRIHELQH